MFRRVLHSFSLCSLMTLGFVHAQSLWVSGITDPVAANGVYDILRRRIRMLYSGLQPAGNYQVYWNGAGESGSGVPSGTYFIRMETENIQQVQKVLLVR